MGLPKWFTDGFAVNLPRLRLSNEVEVIEVEVEVVVVVVVVAAAAIVVVVVVVVVVVDSFAPRFPRTSCPATRYHAAPFVVPDRCE